MRSTTIEQEVKFCVHGSDDCPVCEQQDDLARECRASQYDPAQAIKIAADSIDQLRKVDVFRLLDWEMDENRAALADYIKTQRPDLADEVDDVLQEINEGDAPGEGNPAQWR